MRLATYSQRSAATRASTVAIILLVVTILQGSSGTLSLFQHFSPALIPVATLIWFGLYLAAFAGLMFTHGINWIFWISRYRFLLVILLLGAALSVSWSIDPATSMQRTVHLLGSSIVAIYFGFMIPLSSILKVFSWVLGLILFASIAAVFLIPELGIENYEGTRVWRGILSSKNTLGFWAAAGVLLYLSQLSNPAPFHTKAMYLFMAGISLLTLYFCHSATSLLALIVSGALCLYFFISIRFQIGFVQMAVMAIMMTTLVVFALINIDTAELVGRSGDLTGRGEVWEQTWKLILLKPLTGYGYGSIWNPNDATLWIQQSLTDFTWVVFHAHNGFLQVASEIGLPLSCIALLWVVQQLIEIFYCQYDRQQLGVLFVLGFVVAFLISNYSEARFLMNRELYWIFFITLPISMLRQVNLVLEEETVDEEPEDPPYRPQSTTDQNDKQAWNAKSADIAFMNELEAKPAAADKLEKDASPAAAENVPALSASRLDETLDAESLNELSGDDSVEDTDSDDKDQATARKKDELDRLFEQDDMADTASVNFDPYGQFKIEDAQSDSEDRFDKTMEQGLDDPLSPQIDILLDDSEHAEKN